MKVTILPKRAFNSPLVKYANFTDDTHINLIQLNKPYANGYGFAIHDTTLNPFCSSGMYKTIEQAEKEFYRMVNDSFHDAMLLTIGVITNTTTERTKRV